MAVAGFARPARPLQPLVRAGRLRQGEGRPEAAEVRLRLRAQLAAHHAVYLEPDKLFNNDQGQQCPMAYFMKDGSGYQVYGLLGGP